MKSSPRYVFGPPIGWLAGWLTLPTCLLVALQIAAHMEADPFIEFPEWAADEWTLEEIDAFFDSCGEWEPPRK